MRVPSVPAANSPPGVRAANAAGGAKFVLAGTTVAAAARQLGVSQSWASREASAAGTRVLIAELLEPYRVGACTSCLTRHWT